MVGPRPCWTVIQSGEVNIWPYWDLSPPDDVVRSIAILSILPSFVVGLLVAEQSQHLGSFQLDLKLLEEVKAQKMLDQILSLIHLMCPTTGAAAHPDSDK